MACKKYSNTFKRHSIISGVQKGFTILELMITLAISVLILASILQIFFGSQTTDRMAKAISRVQESGRIAMKLITDDIQMIGYQGCADLEFVPPNIIAENVSATNLLNNTVKGWKVTNSGWESGDQTSPEGPAGINSSITNSDAIQIIRASNQSAELKYSMTSNDADITLSPSLLQLNQNDLTFISDCENSDIFRVTNSPDNNASEVTIAHATGASQNTTANLSIAYSKNSSQVMKYISHTYFVRQTGRKDGHGNDILSLYMKDANDAIHEVIEGVENMQILYGEELDSGNIKFRSADTDDIDWTKISVIKFSLLVSSLPVLSTDDNRTYIVAGTQMTPGNNSGSTPQYTSNKRLRRSFTTSVRVNNRID